ncbi:MAG TPA: universal stress protein [Streptosporangiaceae bacterium]|nr:universal stress protein [Streptosporangiaceae bacterium]
MVPAIPYKRWNGRNPAVQDTDPAHEQQMRRAAEELARKAATRIGAAQPASVIVRAITGFPAKELIEASRDADLVVVGSRGVGGFAPLVMGLGQRPGHAARPLPGRCDTSPGVIAGAGRAGSRRDGRPPPRCPPK